MEEIKELITDTKEWAEEIKSHKSFKRNPEFKPKIAADSSLGGNIPIPKKIKIYGINR